LTISKLMLNEETSTSLTLISRTMRRTSAQYLYFFIVPIVLLVVGFFYLKCSGIFFLKCVDPEYAYLFNGALLADMKPDISYVDHPGTPMMCIIGLVIRIVHLFRPGQDMLSDVLTNPEVFIRSTIYTVNLLGAGMLFLLGVVTYKKTHHLMLALFVQFIPFVHNLGMEPLARLIPESLMLSIICVWVMLIISLVYEKEPAKQYTRYGFAFGILFGLSLADKLTLMPFALIPLSLLPDWKSKAAFTGTSVVSFFIFAFPILFKYRSFSTWVKNLIIHTGAYGSGDVGIFHPKEFIEHLKLQLHNTPLLWASLLLLVLSLLIYVFFTGRGKKRESWKVRLSVATICLIMLQYFITSKQFSYHYMLPGILLTLPMLILSGTMLKQAVPFTIPPVWVNTGMVCMLIIMMIRLIPIVNRQLSQMEENTVKRTVALQQFLRMRQGGPTILGVSYYGCSAQEYALTFGLHVSGKYGSYLFQKVKILYPETYLYFPWGKVYYEGNKEILPKNFVRTGITYNLYIADYSEDRLKEILASLSDKDVPFKYTLTRVYVLPETSEGLFRLQFQQE
jgi:hypothetical protein